MHSVIQSFMSNQVPGLDGLWLLLTALLYTPMNSPANFHTDMNVLSFTLFHYENIQKNKKTKKKNPNSVEFIMTN